jgi:S1-C subfamily serine protease
MTLRALRLAVLFAALATPLLAQPAKPPPLAPGAAPAPPPALARPPALPPSPAPPVAAAPPAASRAPGAATKPPPLRPGEPLPQAPVASSGTGFVVAAGRVMTNHHVVEGCQTLRVRRADGQMLDARTLRSEREVDLAVLEVAGDPGPPLTFRSSPHVRRGEGVVTYGFPLSDILSGGPTLTTGEISALAGMGDNQRQFQISAPVQPGNSGGPLLDMAGHVVGVVVSKLNAQRVAQRIGDIPQNVNFAVKGEEAMLFLRAAGVEPRAAVTGALRSAADVGDVAHASTVFVQCRR